MDSRASPPFFKARLSSQGALFQSNSKEVNIRLVDGMDSSSKSASAEINSNGRTLEFSIPAAALQEIDYEEECERIMNDTTMPPPRPSSSVSTSTKYRQNDESKNAVTTEKSSIVTSATAKVPLPRKKVGRFGLSDWTRLLSVSNDLAQRKGQPIRSKIAWKEIKQHNSVYDGWMVIKNKVYNITPYLPYHPGGEKILRSSLGKDGTALYEKYHRWVNEDGYVSVLFSFDILQ